MKEAEVDVLLVRVTIALPSPKTLRVLWRTLTKLSRGLVELRDVLSAALVKEAVG